ncbi:hypothetical protein [Alistipes sp.]|uniref:hypothetical protein n=1 Tax=Alistipes sp. TaxID=1872444 RepID=UPI00352974AF
MTCKYFAGKNDVWRMFFFVNTLRSRRKAEDFGTPPRGKRIAAEPFISFGDQPIDHFTLRSDCFEELTDTVEFVPRDRRGGVGVFHLVLALNRKTKSGFVFPAAKHQIGLPGH